MEAIKSVLGGLDWASLVTGLLAAFAVMAVIGATMKRPQLAAYMPMIAQAAKRAEALISDDTPNKSLRKLDLFLREFCSIYQDEYKNPPPKSVKELAVRGASIMAREFKSTAQMERLIDALSKVTEAGHGGGNSDTGGAGVVAPKTA